MNPLNSFNSLFVLFLLVQTSMSLIPSLDSVEIIKNSPSDAGSCPHCTNSVEMPVELADRIDAVDDIDVFMHDFVEDKDALTNVTNVKNTRIRRAAKETMKQATCQPIDQVVSVVPADERDPTVFYFPSCVLIKQCGGCCAHSGTSCTAVETEDKTVTIRKTKFVGGSKLQSMGDVTVQLKIHKKCRCQCMKTANDCNFLQRYIPGQCRCECTNLKEAEECTNNPKKLWDSEKCRCVCRNTRDCGSDSIFDQEECECKPRPKEESTEDVDEEHFFGEHTYNETDEAAEPLEESKYETATTNA